MSDTGEGRSINGPRPSAAVGMDGSSGSGDGGCGTCSGPTVEYGCLTCGAAVAACGDSSCAATALKAHGDGGHTFVVLPPSGVQVVSNDGAVALLALRRARDGAALSRAPDESEEPIDPVPRLTAGSGAALLIGIVVAVMYGYSWNIVHSATLHVYDCEHEPKKLYLFERANVTGCAFNSEIDARSYNDAEYQFSSAILIVQAFLILLFIAVASALLGLCGRRFPFGARILAFFNRGLSASARRDDRGSVVVVNSATVRAVAAIVLSCTFLCFPVASVGGLKIYLMLPEGQMEATSYVASIGNGVATFLFFTLKSASKRSASDDSRKRARRCVVMMGKFLPFYFVLVNVLLYVAVVNNYSQWIDVTELIHVRGAGFLPVTLFNLFASLLCVAAFAM